MSRINLNVSFSEKDEVKKLGARWDAANKVWYIPEGIDQRSFKKWLPEAVEINIRSDSYFIAQTTKSCWKCKQRTQVFGFLLPAGHEILKDEDEYGNDGDWYQSDIPSTLHYITHLTPKTINNIRSFSSQYRTDFSKTTQSSYWMNHCDSCGSKQGDFEMFCEPQGAFCPMNKIDASHITLHYFDELFECEGSPIYGTDDFLEDMTWS